MDQVFSAPKGVRFATFLEQFYESLCKVSSAVPGRTTDEFEPILGKKFMG